MTRAAYYDFTIGNFTLAELNIRHLIDRITFTEEVGKFDSVTIELQKGPELNQAYTLLKHGSVFQLSGGYYNEIIKPMMLGFIKGVGVSCSQRSATINIFGYLGALDKGEKQRVLQNRTIRQVVEEIVADYPSLVVGTIENGDTLISETSSQSNQTDLKYLESIARQFGMKWKTEPTENNGVWALSMYSMISGDDADSHPTLVFDPYKTQQTRSNFRHLKEFDVESNIMGVSSSVNILSNNPNQPINVSSEDFDPNIYQTGEVNGSTIVYEVFGTVNTINFYENVSNDEAAQIIANLLQEENELRFVHANNGQLSEGDCELRAGQYRNVILNDIPLFGSVFSGKYLITKTNHTWGKQESYDTTFEAARSCLTPPPPPELDTGGSGGSGGTPVIIRWMPNGILMGWYASFGPNNEVILGAEITEEQIRANSYWMDVISNYGFTGPIPIGGIRGNSYQNGTTPFETGDVFTDIMTATPSIAFGQMVAPMSPYSSEWYIDFPPSWTTNPLAGKLRGGPAPTIVPAILETYTLGTINEESIDDYLDAQGEARHSDAATREDEIYARQNEKNSRYQAFWGSGNE
jgi:hypothetical protein